MEQKVNSTVFDVTSKSEVTLSKIFDFVEATSADAALQRIGNDAKAFLAIVNEGLRQHEREQAVNNNSIPWKTEDGEVFTGDVLTEEQTKKLSATVLTLAKTMFGYVGGTAGTAEGRKKAKEEAQAFILNAPGALDRLRA